MFRGPDRTAYCLNGLGMLLFDQNVPEPAQIGYNLNLVRFDPTEHRFRRPLRFLTVNHRKGSIHIAEQTL